MTSNKIPQTDSIRELAQFWDTHDLTDYEDQLKEVTEPVFQREAVVEVRLTARDAEAVEGIARTQGVNPADLIRSWVAEKVQTLS